MFINSLHLRSFRNFRDQSFSFSPSFNILLGDNAQGKTNIVEAISLLSCGRSFRTANWRDLIERNREEARVDAVVSCGRGEDRVSVHLAEPRKRFLRNDKAAAPGGFDSVAAVLFAPEEILLLKTQPAARRRFIDALVSSFVPGHRKLVRDYEAVVTQRNRIYADESLGEGEVRKLLSPWDDQLVSLGARVVLARHSWTSRLNETLPRRYHALAEGDGEATLRYEPQVGLEALAAGAEGIMSAMEDLMRARRGDELSRRTSVVGPHRDDLVAYIGQERVRGFASQGQHRSFVLALKITEMELYRAVKGEAPILLLDDVASELDPERNRRFFEYVQNAEGQVFITTTRAESVMTRRRSESAVIAIADGKATPL